MDDAVRVNDRLTLNLGVRYDHNTARIPTLDVRDQEGNPTGETHPRARPLHLERGGAAARLQPQADEGREDRAAGSLWTLLPRDRDLGVLDPHRGFAPRHPLGTLRSGDGTVHRSRGHRVQPEPEGGPELQEPLHRPVRGQPGAGALQELRRVRALHQQEGATQLGLGRPHWSVRGRHHRRRHGRRRHGPPGRGETPPDRPRGELLRAVEPRLHEDRHPGHHRPGRRSGCPITGSSWPPTRT